MTATSPSPVYLVKGGDPYLVDSAVLEIVHSITGDEAVGLATEDHAGSGGDMSTVVEACRTPPFLTERRVVVVREASEMGADGAAMIADYLADPIDTSVLVLSWGSGRVLAALDKAIKVCGGEVVDASVPTGAKGRSDWLGSRVTSSGMRLDARARELMARHLGEDVDRVDGLLASLEAAYGPGAKVGEGELEPFLGSAGDLPPWDFTDAIDRADSAEALRCLQRMTGAGGRQALAVMAILHRHYSEMLRLDGTDISSDAEAAKLLGISSTFRAGKVRKQAVRLGGPHIARALTLLADADLDLKGGSGWPPEVVMEVLVARLSRLVAQQRSVASRRS